VSANETNISQIRKYLNGELDARAMHELERQALHDPFLADALEGYTIKNDQQQNLADLQKRLQQRTVPTRKRLTLLPVLTIAASVLLFVAAGGWWLVNSRSSTVKELPAADHAMVNAKPVMPVVKAPVPAVHDSAVLKPASTDNLVVAENRKGSKHPNSLNNQYAPPPAAIVAEPQAESMPAKPNALQADEAIAYSPQLAQRLASNKAAGASRLPGGSPEIRLRGLASVTGKEPLYIVDGRIYEGKLSDFNNNDIEKISVLKDASSTAIYGSRAANGVILITTKPGSMAKLKSDSSALSKNMLADVVIVGYGTQHKTSVVGAISGVKPVETNRALQGTLASAPVSKRNNSPNANDALRTITGKVVGKDGFPLSGVIVAVAGQDQKALTNADGKFKINAKENDELTLAYVGYENKKLNITGEDSVNVTMKQDGKALAEVVVVGYGTQKKTSVVGSLSKTKPVETEQASQGALPAVEVVESNKRPKADDSIRTITGTILDKRGFPLPDVSVSVAGKNNRVQTDASGKFKIRASNEDELTLNLLGYESKLIKVKSKNSLKVSLRVSTASLSEVAIRGFGTNKNEPEPARPQNGWKELNKYLKENTEPINGKTGVVQLSFVVNPDQSLTDFKILKSLSPEADKAAIKLIADGPGWVPNTNKQPETVRLRIRFKK